MSTQSKECFAAGAQRNGGTEVLHGAHVLLRLLKEEGPLGMQDRFDCGILARRPRLEQGLKNSGFRQRGLVNGVMSTHTPLIKKAEGERRQ